MPAKVQASEPTYELHSLGWKAFQDLCVTITSEVLGQTTQTFLPARDGGRDGAFHGTWHPEGGSGRDGSFTVQCKFSSRGAALHPADLHDEFAKAARLAKRGLATNYILMTNRSVSGEADAEIRRQFLSLEGLDEFFLFGREWITQKIRASASLRMLVPRVYGLGDLSQILDERAYAQASAILSVLGDDLAKFVVTEPYTRAAKALVSHGFVLLLGEPAAGKSTIAAGLAMGALDKWGCLTVKVLNADELIRHWNPNEPRQFFWVDDAFGTTQYQQDLAANWNRAWPHLRAAVRKGTRILFTSRDYIYRAARRDLKLGAFPLVNESQVVIDVQRLSRPEKEQILYNHIKLGQQPIGFRRRIKPFLRGVAANYRFLPEIARRLGDPVFTKDLRLEHGAISKFVEEPLAFLVEVVTNLDSASRAALALVFMRGGLLSSPIELNEHETAALDVLGVSLPEAREALGTLDGSLVAFVRSGDNSAWKFRHPTIGDAYASIVAADPELLDIYLDWTRPGKLIAEVTCGDVGLEGVKVIVPASRYRRFAARLDEVEVGAPLWRFLARRCSAEFLRMYREVHPDLADLVCAPRSYLGASAEVALLIRLYEVEQLPEDWRRRFVVRAGELAIETPDLDFLADETIRRLFTTEELTQLRDRIREDLVPGLEEIAEAWGECCDDDEDPDEHYSPLREVLSTLENEFSDDAGVKAVVRGTNDVIDAAIQSILENRPPEPDEDYDYSGFSTHAPEGERGVFDDVDE